MKKNSSLLVYNILLKCVNVIILLKGEKSASEMDDNSIPSLHADNSLPSLQAVSQVKQL